MNVTEWELMEENVSRRKWSITSMFQKDQVRQHLKRNRSVNKKSKSYMRGGRGQVAMDDGMNRT